MSDVSAMLCAVLVQCGVCNVSAMLCTMLVQCGVCLCVMLVFMFYAVLVRCGGVYNVSAMLCAVLVQCCVRACARACACYVLKPRLYKGNASREVAVSGLLGVQQLEQEGAGLLQSDRVSYSPSGE